MTEMPDIQRKRTLARERQQRLRDRRRDRMRPDKRVGRFHYWDGLINALLWAGAISKREADLEQAAEIGVDRLLNRLASEPEEFALIFSRSA